MSGPEATYDPFYEAPPSEDDDGHDEESQNGRSSRRGSFGDVQGAFEDEHHSSGPIPLRLVGRGLIAVQSSATEMLSITVRTGIPGSEQLRVEIEPNQFYLTFGTYRNRARPVAPSFSKLETACWLNPGERTTYWLSVDSKNGLVKFGKHYTNASMVLATYVLKVPRTRGKNLFWIVPEWAWLNDVKEVLVVQDAAADDDLKVKVQPLPVVSDRSPWIKSADSITLADLEVGNYTIPTYLPEVCQKLLATIGSAGIQLNEPDFPEFSRAIQRSVTIEASLGREMLREKAKNAGVDLSQTYLRISLGSNFGESPGCPYVLEIWPAGHSSPIHDHGDAYGIIRVLHGQLDARYFETLEEATTNRFIKPIRFQTGDMTWLSPQCYQVHQFLNTGTDVCVTINAYQYDHTESVLPERFRYLDTNLEEQEFEPVSDMVFKDFKDAIQAEYRASLDEDMEDN